MYKRKIENVFQSWLEIEEYKQSQHNDLISITSDPINAFADPIKRQLYQAIWYIS